MAPGVSYLIPGIQPKLSLHWVIWVNYCGTLRFVSKKPCVCLIQSTVIKIIYHRIQCYWGVYAAETRSLVISRSVSNSAIWRFLAKNTVLLQMIAPLWFLHFIWNPMSKVPGEKKTLTNLHVGQLGINWFTHPSFSIQHLKYICYHIPNVGLECNRIGKSTVKYPINSKGWRISTP